jgi:hypothetical protein
MKNNLVELHQFQLENIKTVEEDESIKKLREQILSQEARLKRERKMLKEQKKEDELIVDKYSKVIYKIYVKKYKIRKNTSITPDKFQIKNKIKFEKLENEFLQAKYIFFCN